MYIKMAVQKTSELLLKTHLVQEVYSWRGVSCSQLGDTGTEWQPVLEIAAKANKVVVFLLNNRRAQRDSDRQSSVEFTQQNSFITSP